MFQVAHNKWDLSFKGPTSAALEEHFANLDVHDQTFDANDISLYFAIFSPISFDFSILCDFFDPPAFFASRTNWCMHWTYS